MDRTLQINSFIKEKGYNLHEIYECEFNEMRKTK